jgi:mRNA interferase YafQ
MLKVVLENSFLKDVKKLKKRNYDLKLLKKVIDLISTGEQLPKEYREHYLTGNWKRI